jgi:hypothetical protein
VPRVLRTDGRQLRDARQLTLDGRELLLGDAGGKRVDDQDNGLHEPRMPQPPRIS